MLNNLVSYGYFNFFRKSTSITLEQSLAEAQIDTSRIVDPSMGLTSEALYQYLPATKLKGMDDWVPESLHYSYLSSKFLCGVIVTINRINCGSV